MLNPENTLADAVLREVGTRWRVNQLTFIDEEIGFVYLAAPASANVRTIGSLQKGVAHLRGQTLELPTLKKVLNRDECIIASPKALGFQVFNQMLEDESVIKFTFVRDPIERFAAVYRNQFSINTKNGVQRVKLFEFLGVPLEENLSMLDLAELMAEEEGLKALSPQLMAQRKLLAFDLLDYDFIGRHETWDKDFPRISMEVFGCETPVFDPVIALSADPEGARLPVNVDAETREVLQEVYADDYEMINEIEDLFPDGFAAE